MSDKQNQTYMMRYRCTNCYHVQEVLFAKGAHAPRESHDKLTVCEDCGCGTLVKIQQEWGKP